MAVPAQYSIPFTKMQFGEHDRLRFMRDNVAPGRRKFCQCGRKACRNANNARLRPGGLAVRCHAVPVLMRQYRPWQPPSSAFGAMKNVKAVRSHLDVPFAWSCDHLDSWQCSYQTACSAIVATWLITTQPRRRFCPPCAP